MTFFGAEVTPGKICWIDATPECNVELTNACLLKHAKKRNARVVLEVCEPPEEQDPPQRVALAVLSASGIENISLRVLLTARMGLRIAGDDIEGAVVHVVGNEMYPDDHGFLADDDDMGLHQDLVDIVLASDSDDDSEGSNIDGSDDSDEEIKDFQKELGRTGGNKRKAKRQLEGEHEGGGKLVVRPKTGKPSTGGLPVISHTSGLKFQDLLIGSGKKVRKGHNVALSYVLRLENGKVIDRADRKRPFKFRLGIGECVKGFDIGVIGMHEGGERHLIVPPELGYGLQSPPGIPKNSTLFFDVVVMKAF